MPYLYNGIELVLPPPKGYVIDLDNPQRSKVMEHYVVCAVGGTLAALAIIQRFYTKIFLLRGLHLDDAFMFLAWCTSVATQALTLWLIIAGVDNIHGWELRMDQYAVFQVGLYTSAPVYMLCSGFTKLSLLTFYLQLSPATWWRNVVWASIAVVAIYTVVCTLMLVFPCRPINKAWDVFFPADMGECIALPPLYIVTAASNIVTDLICFVLPLKMVVGLNMKRQLKIGAVIVFLIASMTIITSFVRLFYLFPMLTSNDITWDTAAPSVWVFVEANLFIICGSMPTLSKFFSHFGFGFLASSSAATTDGDPASGQPRRHYNNNGNSGSDRYANSSTNPKGTGYRIFQKSTKTATSTTLTIGASSSRRAEEGGDEGRYHRFSDDEYAFENESGILPGAPTHQDPPSQQIKPAKSKDKCFLKRSCSTDSRLKKQGGGPGGGGGAVMELRSLNDTKGQKRDDLAELLVGGTHDVAVGAGSTCGDDDRSDKAIIQCDKAIIIQSKTFTIQYD